MNDEDVKYMILTPLTVFCGTLLVCMAMSLNFNISIDIAFTLPPTLAIITFLLCVLGVKLSTK